MARLACLLSLLAVAFACARDPVAFIPPDSVPTRLGATSAVFGVPYCGDEDPERTLDLYRPATPRAAPPPVAVYVHGGGWRTGDKREGPWFERIGRALLARGFAVASIDYRLAPADPWPRMLDDVRCAFDFLERAGPALGFDPDRIGTWGTSAGAHLAAMTALAEEPAARVFVGLYGIYDLTGGDLSEPIRLAAIGAFGAEPGSGARVLDEASPVRLASSDDVPTLLVHGAEDSVVPPGQSERLEEGLRRAGAPVELILVAHAEHQFVPAGAPIDPSVEEITAAVVAFLEARL